MTEAKEKIQDSESFRTLNLEGMTQRNIESLFLLSVLVLRAQQPDCPVTTVVVRKVC